MGVVSKGVVLNCIEGMYEGVGCGLEFNGVESRDLEGLGWKSLKLKCSES